MEKALKVVLFNVLQLELEKHGFSPNLAGDCFIRQRDEVTDMLTLAIPGHRIQPGVAVRIERVEEIFHQTSRFERKYQKGTPTMGTFVWALLGNGRQRRTCEFTLESEPEVALVAAKIVDVFRNIALPYFERWSSLQAIDAELNTNPSSLTPHRAIAWFRCSTGIIVARLLGRPDYEELAAFYTNIMTQVSKGFYLGRFKALLKSLESVNQGCGLSI